MKFSFGSKDQIEQNLTITVADKSVEDRVQSELNSAMKSSKIKGFRKGKAPMEVVKKMYEPEIRQDVINDLVTKEFYKLVEKNDLKPVGRPNLTPEKIDKGKDIVFKASFEVYPEIKVSNLKRLNYKKTICSITDADVDKTVETIRKRTCSWEIKDGPSEEGDQVKIDFIGKINGEEFEGGNAKDFIVEIGSKSMIEGFEDGLVGLTKEEKTVLALNFPKDYGKTDLASKEVEFEIEVKEILKAKLPDLNEDLFRSTGIEVKTLQDFKKEIKVKLNEDLDNLIKNKSKNSLFDSLVESNPFKVPSAMIDSEVENLRINAARRVGMDPKDLKEDLFPRESFLDEAEKRVGIGILLNKIIEDKELKADGDRVKKIIEERASMFKEPDQVVNWYYSNEEQLKSVESIALEEQVIDILMLEATPQEEELTYEECVNNI